MAYESEALLEKNLISQLSNQGYDEIVIEDYDALTNNFRAQFNEFNKANLAGTPLTDSEFRKLMIGIEGNGVFKSAKLIRGKQELEREDGSILYYRLFNTKEWCKNIFQVTSQVKTEGDKFKVRYDVTLLINGLPMVQIELKRRGLEFSKAFHQIKRYHKDKAYKGLFDFIQIFVGSNGMVTKYFANSDYDIPISRTFYWTDKENAKIEVLSDFTADFLEKCHIAKMIARYMVIKEASKELMVMRPYQVYGAENIIRQATETANNGYIWHTTGSGKTLTSFKVSQILANHGKFAKVVFLVDRKDLDGQTYKEFNKFEEGSVDRTTDTRVLVDHFRDRNRKLVITTIQKMRNAISNKRYASVLDAYRDENVVFIIDECHRSQFGDMHKAIAAHFRKGQYFGFTGTPRFEENKSEDGRSTADLFGRCLHSYLIKNAIADGTTLPFSVEYVNTIKMIDVDEDEKIHGIRTKEALEAPERLKMIAGDVLKDRRRKSENGAYNALFTVSSIPSLVKYYDSFKEYTSTIEDDTKRPFIAAIYTYDANEDFEDNSEHSRESLERIIDDYNMRFGTNFSTERFSEYFVDVADRFKKGGIDILLVVNMFLTGYDSPRLNTLYIDRNLEHHGLIQAFSRTNRTEKPIKHSGFIRSYRNLKEKTDDAIKLFSKTDSTDIVLAIPYEEQLALFEEAIESLLAIAPSPDVTSTFESETEKKDFILAFREVARQLVRLTPFADFDFDNAGLKINEQDFNDFRSKYLNFKDETDESPEKVSILGDIDFAIDEILADKINVDYILNLIRTSDMTDKETREKIKQGIRHADSKELRYKSQYLLEFMEQVAPHLKSDDSPEKALDEFVDRLKEEHLTKFSQQVNLEVDTLRDLVGWHEFNGKSNRLHIMKLFKLPFLAKTRMANEVEEFIQDFIRKYAKV